MNDLHKAMVACERAEALLRTLEEQRDDILQPILQEIYPYATDPIDSVYQQFEGGEIQVTTSWMDGMDHTVFIIPHSVVIADDPMEVARSIRLEQEEKDRMLQQTLLSEAERNNLQRQIALINDFNRKLTLALAEKLPR